MSETTMTTVRPTRPLLWSLRRELWENPAIYLGPLILAGLVLLAFLAHLTGLAGDVQRAVATGKGANNFLFPYPAVAGALFVLSALIAIFYCLGALHGERRDRSLLFWKSMPVSDARTVLAKFAVPMVVQPLVVLALTAAAHLVMLAFSLVLLAANGADVGFWWSNLHLPLMWAMLPYGLVVNALWAAPVFGWLFLVSAWAKRMTFVWAIAPWLVAELLEFLAFRTQHIKRMVDYRLMGGFNEAFTVKRQGGAAVTKLAETDPVGFLTNPSLWTGLLFAAVCLAACVWLRRRAEPI